MSERKKRIEEILEIYLELSPDERKELLAKADEIKAKRGEDNG